MIKVLLFAIVLILCWPIALVVGVVWLVVATMRLLLGVTSRSDTWTPGR